MRRILIILFAITLTGCMNGKKISSSVSITCSIESINNELFKVTFYLENNDTIDYFIPFIKPANQYSRFSDVKGTKGIQGNIPVDYYLTNKLLTREDLRETAELDSVFFCDKNDTMYFYFEEPFVKKYYDSILTNYKNKEKLFFIYPFFYHAIGSCCIYLKSGGTKQIVNYVRHYYPIEVDDLIVMFDFDTDSVPGYKEEFFKSIPQKIENYHLFKGKIQISNKSEGALTN